MGAGRGRPRHGARPEAKRGGVGAHRGAGRGPTPSGGCPGPVPRAGGRARRCRPPPHGRRVSGGDAVVGNPRAHPRPAPCVHLSVRLRSLWLSALSHSRSPALLHSPPRRPARTPSRRDCLRYAILMSAHGCDTPGPMYTHDNFQIILHVNPWRIRFQPTARGLASAFRHFDASKDSKAPTFPRKGLRPAAAAGGPSILTRHGRTYFGSRSPAASAAVRAAPAPARDAKCRAPPAGQDHQSREVAAAGRGGLREGEGAGALRPGQAARHESAPGRADVREPRRLRQRAAEEAAAAAALPQPARHHAASRDPYPQPPPRPAAAPRRNPGVEGARGVVHGDGKAQHLPGAGGRESRGG